MFLGVFVDYFSGFGHKGKRASVAPSIPPVFFGCDKINGVAFRTSNLNLPLVIILVNTFRSEGAATHRKGLACEETEEQPDCTFSSNS